MTAAKASASMAWRYSAGIDPQPFVDAILRQAERDGVEVCTEWFGKPLHLDRTDPIVGLVEQVCGSRATAKSYSTDASELQGLAPCIVLGPRSIASAYTLREHILLRDLAGTIPIFSRLAVTIAEQLDQR